MPTFQGAIDLTINPSEIISKEISRSLKEWTMEPRLATWGHEASKFFASPILGTGFYHRGGASGL